MNNTTTLTALGRRRFIQLAALGMSGLVLSPCTQALSALSTTAELQVGNKLYRGTRDGLILRSVDNGMSWQKIANFGDRAAVDALQQDDQGGVSSHLRHGGHTFWVRCTNDLHWISSEYVRPA